MNRAMYRQIGTWAGYLTVPLLVVGALLLVTFRRFDTPVIVVLILLAITVIIYATSNPIGVRGTLGKQMVGSSLSAVVVAVAAIGILILVNVLLQRITVRTDLTTNQQFSVTPQTVEVLQKLKEPVKLTVFYSTEQGGDLQKSQIQDRLKEYTSRTDKLNVTYIDVNLDPVTTREFNIQAVPTVVFQQGKQRQDVTSNDEQSFTRALLAVQSTVQRRVFFVTGHNERPITAGSAGDSFSQAVKALKDNNYLVDTINLLNFSTGGTITNTNSTQPFKLDPVSDVLVFGGPRTPYSDTEKQNAVTFLKQGGKALLLDDPLSSASNLPPERRDNLNDILKDFNLKFTSGLVVEVDPQRRLNNTPILFVPQTVGSSDILRNLQNAPILLAQSTRIEAGQAVTSTTASPFDPLLQSSVNSYLKTDLQNLSQPFDPAKDVRGPITVAASYQAPVNEQAQGAKTLNTRMVLVGSYLFASDDQTIGVSPSSGTANYLFFLNTLNWLSEQNDTVVIAPQSSNSKPFAINESQGSFIFWSTFLGLPLLVLFIGLAVWWRRR